jgi:hypothetical protein
MCAVGEEAFQPRLGLRHRVGLGDADRVEAARACLDDERGFDFFGIAQKSRSA